MTEPTAQFNLGQMWTWSTDDTMAPTGVGYVSSVDRDGGTVTVSAPAPTFTQRMTSVGWLPARTRAKLSRDIAARNALDRRLAEQHGLAPDDPACARYPPGGTDALDRMLRKRRAAAQAVYDARAERNRAAKAGAQ